MMTWTAEDQKLVTLAKGARTRVGAQSGAALRDTTGRTYASAEVNTEFLNLTAVQLVVGQAIASGASGIEAVVVCSETAITEQDRKIISGFSNSAEIYLINLAGDHIDS